MRKGICNLITIAGYLISIAAVIIAANVNSAVVLLYRRGHCSCNSTTRMVDCIYGLLMIIWCAALIAAVVTSTLKLFSNSPITPVSKTNSAVLVITLLALCVRPFLVSVSFELQKIDRLSVQPHGLLLYILTQGVDILFLIFPLVIVALVVCGKKIKFIKILGSVLCVIDCLFLSWLINIAETCLTSYPSYHTEHHHYEDKYLLVNRALILLIALVIVTLLTIWKKNTFKFKFVLLVVVATAVLFVPIIVRTTTGDDIPYVSLELSLFELAVKEPKLGYGYGNFSNMYYSDRQDFVSKLLGFGGL